MNAQTLQALQKSIAHWKRMRADRHGCNEEPDGHYCPLCELFASSFERCTDCPVWKATGRRQCETTPFYAARNAWEGQDEAAWQRAASKEIKFLQSLLPKPRRKPRRLTPTPSRNRKSKIKNRKS